MCCGCAVGVDLPVLADLGSEAVLRFSELFGGELVPQARRRAARKPRQERQPSESLLNQAVFFYSQYTPRSILVSSVYDSKLMLCTWHGMFKYRHRASRNIDCHDKPLLSLFLRDSGLVWIGCPHQRPAAGRHPLRPCDAAPSDIISG